MGKHRREEFDKIEDSKVQKECDQGKKIIEIAQETRILKKIYNRAVTRRCLNDTRSQM